MLSQNEFDLPYAYEVKNRKKNWLISIWLKLSRKYAEGCKSTMQNHAYNF